MLIISHRGDTRRAPENTLDAFRSALAWGVDGIETDVRLTVTGEAILYHNRIAPSGDHVDELTREQLSQQVGFEVPTIAAALELSDRILWNLEIKTPTAIEATIAHLEPFLRSHRVLITSFWHCLMQTMSQRLDVDFGLLISHHPIQFPLPAAADDVGVPRLKALAWNYEWLEPAFVEEANRRGLQNIVWNVESRREHEHCRQLGVFAVITDHLDRAGLTSPETAAAHRAPACTPLPSEHTSPTVPAE